MPIQTIVAPVPWQTAEVQELFGPQTKPEPTDVGPENALLSINTEFVPGYDVQTRNGFGAYFNPSMAITSLFNWVKAADAVSSTGNYLAIYNKTANKASLFWGTNYGSVADIVQSADEAADFASSGNQLFTAILNVSAQTTPKGVAQCRVTSIIGSNVDTDVAFLKPLTTKPTLSETGTGVVTPGAHFVGYLITTRSGFTGRISPIDSTGAPDATSTITATGGKQIHISLTATWPTEAVSVTFVMTAVTNPYQYFALPNSVQTVTGGGSSTITYNVNLSDATLLYNASGLNDVTNNQFYLTQDQTDFGPFEPYRVLPYGERMAYMVYDGNGTSAVYFSDTENPQALTEQFHKRRLPGFRQMVTAFVKDKVFYVLGPNWTYAFEDNAGQPVTWAQPQQISGHIGTPAVFGVPVGDTSQLSFIPVAHQTGLYIFDGAYPELPATYFIKEWGLINWSYPQSIRVAVHQDKKLIIVAVPLTTDPLTGATLNATVPSHIFAFNYQRGVTPDAIDFSLWTLPAGYGRSVAIVQNQNTGKIELMVGSNNAASKVLRQKNSIDDPMNWMSDDGNTPITMQHEISGQPGGAIGQLLKFTGAYLRVIGSGTPTITAYSLDRAKAVALTKPIVLANSPGLEMWRGFTMTAERASLRFTHGTSATDWMLISGVLVMFFQYASRRRA